MLVHPMRVRCRSFSGLCCQTLTFRSVSFWMKSNESNIDIFDEMWAVFLKSYLCLGCNFSFPAIPNLFQKGQHKIRMHKNRHKQSQFSYMALWMRPLKTTSTIVVMSGNHVISATVKHDQRKMWAHSFLYTFFKPLKCCQGNSVYAVKYHHQQLNLESTLTTARAGTKFFTIIECNTKTNQFKT